jgi:hypothetical protein
MNIYEQLVAIREDLAEQDAAARTLKVMDMMITRAVSQRDSSLSVSRLQVLRHVMSTPEVLNDEDVRLDFLALQGDLEDAAAQRTESGPAYEADRRPKLKKYYKKK